MTVYFHGSFGLNRTYMAKILEAALKGPKLKDKDLGSIFGYGAPFSSRYRSWLHKTGLTEPIDGHHASGHHKGLLFKSLPGLACIRTADIAVCKAADSLPYFSDGVFHLEMIREKIYFFL